MTHSTSSPPPAPDDCNPVTALEREATRLCQRYIDEVVLPFDLCPWAAPALKQQRVEILVISDHVEHIGEALLTAAQRGAAAFDACHERPASELVLLVFPRFMLGRGDFDALLRALRDAHGASRYVMAAFHPDAPLDASAPERLVPFLRRSPDPMIQGVRREVLDRIDPGRGTGTAFMPLQNFLAGSYETPTEQSPRDRVARNNLATVQSAGPEAFQRALEAIHDDRRESYRALGLETRPTR